MKSILRIFISFFSCLIPRHIKYMTKISIDETIINFENKKNKVIPEGAGTGIVSLHD